LTVFIKIEKKTFFPVFFQLFLKNSKKLKNTASVVVSS
jgi:hypothetical protein